MWMNDSRHYKWKKHIVASKSCETYTGVAGWGCSNRECEREKSKKKLINIFVEENLNFYTKLLHFCINAWGERIVRLKL